MTCKFGAGMPYVISERYTAMIDISSLLLESNAEAATPFKH